MTQRAKVYGGSMYDLALEEQLTDTIMDEMLTIRDLFRENPDYLRLLTEPSIKKEERTGLIEKAFGECATRYLVSFLKILCEQNLLNEYEGCLSEFKRRYNRDNNIAEAVVTSAVALDEATSSKLKAKLEQLSGKHVSLTVKIDPKVIAGLKVELDGNELDGTVSGRLSGISKKLNETII